MLGTEIIFRMIGIARRDWRQDQLPELPDGPRFAADQLQHPESKAPPQRLGWTGRKSGFCICSAILPDGCQHPKLNIL